MKENSHKKFAVLFFCLLLVIIVGILGGMYFFQNRITVEVSLNTNDGSGLRYINNKLFEKEFSRNFPSTHKINIFLGSPTTIAFPIRQKERVGEYDYYFSFEKDTINISVQLLTKNMTDEDISFVLEKLILSLAEYQKASRISNGDAVDPTIQETHLKYYQDVINSDMIKNYLLVTDVNP